MKIKGSFTETQFRQAVKVAAKKSAKLQKEILDKFCSNCGRKLTEEGSLAMLDGNPKHGRMCHLCGREALYSKERERCPSCLAYYTGFHTYDGVMKALVDYQKNKSTPRAMLTPEKLVKSKKKLSTKLSSKKCQQCRKPIPEDYWYCDSCANHPSVGGIITLLA